MQSGREDHCLNRSSQRKNWPEDQIYSHVRWLDKTQLILLRFVGDCGNKWRDQLSGSNYIHSFRSKFWSVCCWSVEHQLSKGLQQCNQTSNTRLFIQSRSYLTSIFGNLTSFARLFHCTSNWLRELWANKHVKGVKNRKSRKRAQPGSRSSLSKAPHATTAPFSPRCLMNFTWRSLNLCLTGGNSLVCGSFTSKSAWVTCCYLTVVISSQESGTNFPWSVTVMYVKRTFVLGHLFDKQPVEVGEEELENKFANVCTREVTGTMLLSILTQQNFGNLIEVSSQKASLALEVDRTNWCKFPKYFSPHT